MKLNFYKILLACLTSFSTGAVSGGAYAQDSVYPTIEEISEDAVFSTWSETDPKTGPVKAVKDSVVTATKANTQRPLKVSEPKASKSEESANKEKEEDDSVLSFNFLYYIFQKYKLQDIVD